MTNSSSVLADTLEYEEPTAAGAFVAGGEGDCRHEEISSMTVTPTVTIPPTDELILANGAELDRWYPHNKKLFSVLNPSTKGGANSFLIRFAERSDSRQQREGQAAWKTTT